MKRRAKGFRTDKTFNGRNWKSDQLYVARARKGEAVARRRHMLVNTTEELRREVGHAS